MFWTCGKKSIGSKRISINQKQPIAKYSDKFSKPSKFNFDKSKNSYQQVPSALTLMCNDVKVGVFEFDLSSYIGKKSTDERVNIGMRSPSQSNVLDGNAPKILEGDITKWPGAFIVFRIKVDPSTPQSARHLGNGPKLLESMRNKHK